MNQRKILKIVIPINIYKKKNKQNNPHNSKNYKFKNLKYINHVYIKYMVNFYRGRMDFTYD